mgnify:FL=1
MCFFCTIMLEDSTHRFIECLITSIIWQYLSDIWQVYEGLNNGFFLSMFKMVQMMSCIYCSNFYDIGEYNTIGIKMAWAK